MGNIYIGISGWRYEPWRGAFYPPGLVQARELDYASRFLPTIEINGSFYALQRPASYAAWYAATPPGFVFAVKGNRFITHMLKLRGIETPLANVLASGVFALREKLGPILWQFPPQLRFEPGKIERFLSLLPRDTGQALAIARRHDTKMEGRSLLEIDAVRPLRHAVEVRHESFRDEAFIALLRRYEVALVVADTAGKWPDWEDVTADFVYIRLQANKAERYRFALPNVDHVFLPGHRIMVQIQSSWFPLYDRNPQTFVPNIFHAKAGDFRKATQRVYHAPGMESAIELPVVSAGK